MAGLDLSTIQTRLAEIVQQNGLHALYPEQRLRNLAAEVAQKDLKGLAIRWRLDPQVRLLSFLDFLQSAQEKYFTLPTSSPRGALSLCLIFG